jgi:diguanylate cyclase (GGDEF)-like protein/PAS domain S-box-containing protein
MAPGRRISGTEQSVPVPSTPHAPRTAVALYVAFLAVLAALIPLSGSVRPGEVGPGMAVQTLVILALVLDRRVRHGNRAIALAGIAFYLTSVALLRDGATAGGFGSLVLLPIIWAALRGRRLELVCAIVGGALVFAVPQIVVGAPQYPSTGWRVAVLTTIVGIVIGVSVLRLVERLRASSEHSATILGAMGEGFALTRNSEIIAVNPALCEMLGMSEADLVGARPPYPFWPPEHLEETEEIRRRVVAAGGSEFELMLMCADGARFPASVTAASAELGDGSRAFVNTIRNVTERRAHEDSMRRRADELSAIATVTRAVSHSDPADARRTICELAVEVTGAQSAALWEADAEGVLHNTFMSGRPSTDVAIGHDQSENGSRIVWRTGRPLFVAEGEGSPHVDQRIIHKHFGDRPLSLSMYFRPISDTSGVRAVLVLLWTPSIAEVPPDAEPVLEVLAAEAALAMQRSALLDQLAELSRTDELTGLPNRRAWEELLDRELRVAKRTGLPLSVVMLDLDFFKAYNDQHGHQGGDRLLWLAGHLWRENLRDTDVLARWGGEEFGLLLPACDAISARQLLDRLHELPLDGVTFSAGIAEWDGTSSSEALIGRSDAALYAAKRAGRNRTLTAPSYNAA